MLNPESIVEVLGGYKTLGKTPNSYLELSDMIVEGLPSESVFYVQDQLNIGDEEYSSSLVVSKGWLKRHRKTPVARISTDISNRHYDGGKNFSYRHATP